MSLVAAPSLAAVAADEAVLRTAGLGKTIDERVVLEGITFQLQDGQFAALLGANGAGKTTLLKILATLIAPSAGELSLFGRPVRRSTPQIRSQLGLIGHGTMLYRDLTARENLLLHGRLHGVADAGRRAMAQLQFVGLAGRADDPVKSLSRGMAQRVSIARALMHDPRLLLADEPFSGLDAPSRRRLEELLTTLAGQGRTILLANHDLPQSLALAERLLVLRGGRLVVDAPRGAVDEPTVMAEVTG